MRKGVRLVTEEEMKRAKALYYFMVFALLFSIAVVLYSIVSTQTLKADKVRNNEYLYSCNYYKTKDVSGNTHYLTEWVRQDGDTLQGIVFIDDENLYKTAVLSYNSTNSIKLRFTDKVTAEDINTGTMYRVALVKDFTE